MEAGNLLLFDGGDAAQVGSPEADSEYERLMRLADQAENEIMEARNVLEESASSVFLYQDDESKDGNGLKTKSAVLEETQVGFTTPLAPLLNADAISRYISKVPLLPHAASTQRPWLRRVKGGLRWTRGDERQFEKVSVSMERARGPWNVATLNVRRHQFLAHDVIQGPFCPSEDKVLKDFVNAHKTASVDWELAAQAVSESNKLRLGVIDLSSSSSSSPSASSRVSTPWRRGAWTCLCRYQSVLADKESRKLSSKTDEFVRKVVAIDNAVLPPCEKGQSAISVDSDYVSPAVWTIAGEALGRAPHLLRKRYYQQSRSRFKPGAPVTWTPKEDMRLQRVVKFYSSPTPQWSLIQHHFPGKSDKACRIRFYSIKASGQVGSKVTRGEANWSSVESTFLLQLTNTLIGGKGIRWKEIAKQLEEKFGKARSVKVCRAQYNRCLGRMQQNIEPKVQENANGS